MEVSKKIGFFKELSELFEKYSVEIDIDLENGGWIESIDFDEVGSNRKFKETIGSSTTGASFGCVEIEEIQEYLKSL